MGSSFDVRGTKPSVGKEETIARRMNSTVAQVMNQAGLESEKDVTWEFPPVTVYKSAKDKGKGKNGGTAGDLQYYDENPGYILEAASDKSDMEKILSWDDEKLKKNVSALVEIMTSKNLQMRACIENMFQHFYDGDWAGKENVNDGILYANMVKHDETKRYIKESMRLIKQKLWSEQVHGFLPGMKFDPEVRKYGIKDCWKKYKNEADAVLYNYPLYVRMQDLTYPKYDGSDDYRNGLALAIHDIWACQIDIVDYKINYTQKVYTGTYRFMIFDNFGLDTADIESHAMKPEDKRELGFVAWLKQNAKDLFLDPADYNWFQAWYVLQHNNARSKPCIPFINSIIIDREFSGEVPFRWHAMMVEGVRQKKGY